MALKCYMLDLKDDPELIARYRDWHAPVYRGGHGVEHGFHGGGHRR